jgi:hypothetical protein
MFKGWARSKLLLLIEVATFPSFARMIEIGYDHISMQKLALDICPECSGPRFPKVEQLRRDLS